MTIEIISALDFEEHIHQADRQLYEQSPQMAEHLKKRGYTVQLIGLRVQGDLKVSAVTYSTPIAGGLHMELHNGPIYTDEIYLKEFYQELQTFAKHNHVLELVVKPYDTYQTFDTNGDPISEPNHKVIEDLTSVGYKHLGLERGFQAGDWYYVKDLKNLTTETLRKSFSKKGTSLIKKVNSFGMQIKKLQRDQLALFKEITSATCERCDFEDKPLEYYEYLYDSFGNQAEFLIATLNFQDYLHNLEAEKQTLQDQLIPLDQKIAEGVNSAKINKQKAQLDKQMEKINVRIDEARQFIDKYGAKDVVLAGSLFIYLEKEAVYLHSGSYPEFNKFYAPALLQEHVMLEAIKRGIPLYNFLGISGYFDGNDGVLRFKQNFNGYIEQKPGLFVYYPNPIKYKMISLLKRLLGRS